MSVMKTPGVYIVEKNAFPPSIVEVATAVPAFIGYTAKAEEKGQSLIKRPRRISSMAEFERFFGGAPPTRYTLATKADSVFKLSGSGHELKQVGNRYRLYQGMRHFFMNGGGACFIVAVGLYDAQTPLSASDLSAGIDTLKNEQEPTLVVIPDAVSLGAGECKTVQDAMLMHCSNERQRNRFAILDVPNGDVELGGATDPVDAFRMAIGTTGKDYGAAYYPYLDTTVTEERELDFGVLDAAGLTALAAAVAADRDATPPVQAMGAQLVKKGEGEAEAPTGDAMEPADLHKALYAGSPDYKAVIGEIHRQINRLGPCAAMAGLYTLVDSQRGVWKAPANVSVAGVTKPAVAITHEQQEGLNVTPQGKSVNAIRSFIGEGVLVWGARTLDGNSLDWRYINVRRTMIMLEESCKLAAKALVFEPNVANTWVTIKSMVGNFLTGVWKRGGLAGAVPEDAFSVHCGLGETMTPEDILEGILRVTVLVAVSRPAEFIEITFQQQLQKS
jgi:phage tail sheath protein FI